jgi:hypothetical protein
MWRPSIAPSSAAIEASGADATQSVLLLFTPNRGQGFALALLGTTLLVVLGLLAFLLHRLSQQERKEANQLERFERQLQKLDAGITFDSRRKRLLLGMRDEIVRVNPTIGLHDATRYAEFVLDARRSTQPYHPSCFFPSESSRADFDPMP